MSQTLLNSNFVLKLLTVHGRTREQKKELSGLASWDHIKAVKYVVMIEFCCLQMGRDAGRSIIGGAHIHIFVFCPTNFF